MKTALSLVKQIVARAPQAEEAGHDYSHSEYYINTVGKPDLTVFGFSRDNAIQGHLLKTALMKEYSCDWLCAYNQALNDPDEDPEKYMGFIYLGAHAPDDNASYLDIADLGPNDLIRVSMMVGPNYCFESHCKCTDAHAELIVKSVVKVKEVFHWLKTHYIQYEKAVIAHYEYHAAKGQR